MLWDKSIDDVLIVFGFSSFLLDSCIYKSGGIAQKDIFPEDTTFANNSNQINEPNQTRVKSKDPNMFLILYVDDIIDA
eukprot:snap_masked-scaffold_70-processed-gene-0.30-mRNA-1 protein AED:1.00 eAED:1.00 QI:0/-1/0/0/-1/1/1/0/77